MAISIYYTARRPVALGASEWAEIRRLTAAYSVRGHAAKYHRTGRGWNGEDFGLFEPSSHPPGVVLDGATRLADDTDADFWHSARHWCRLLSELRRLLPDAAWVVHIDGHDIAWDEDRREYDPSA